MEASSFCKLLIIGAPYGIRTRVTALRGPCPRPLDEGSLELDAWTDLARPWGERAGSIRANFLDSSGLPWFERILPPTARDHSKVRAPDFAYRDLSKCPES